MADGKMETDITGQMESEREDKGFLRGKNMTECHERLMNSCFNICEGI